MNEHPSTQFRVALTADFYDESGQPKFPDLGLSLFDEQDSINTSQFSEHHPVITSNQLNDCQGVIVLTPSVTDESLTNCDALLAIGRFGVGYDSVDVKACTENDVLVMITAGAVDRPVAEATVGWMIGLTHHILTKDRIVRTGQWDDRTLYMGCELRDRTLGVIGLGGIGQTLVSLLKGFGMNQPVAFDPFASEEVFQKLGVKSVDLDVLLSTSDFVSIHCPLNEKTYNLIDSRELSLMKPTSYLLNTARGGIVNEDALFETLKKCGIAGAALDCFEIEPVTEPHRFGEFENVILAPHSIAWTDELFRDIGQTACQGMLDLSLGKRPCGVLNPILFERESFRNKWSRLTGIISEELS
jgi:phosphoglycerate dehydrogenase-like enzyme